MLLYYLNKHSLTVACLECELLVTIFVECILLRDQTNQLYHVPSNATQRLYNIQFVLLKSHVSTIISGHHQVNTNA
jgi:hypothetical protein